VQGNILSFQDSYDSLAINLPILSYQIEITKDGSRSLDIR